MTTNEKQLLSQMQSALSGEPAIAQAIKPQPKEALLTPHGPIAYYSRRTNTIVLTNALGENVFVSPECLAALNEFAVRIGWQCD